MQAYSFTAYTSTGRRRSGTQIAESERAAHQALAAQGLLPETITALKGRKAPFARRLDTAQQSVFLRHMAVLLEAELSIASALEAVETSVSNATLQRVCAGLRAATLEGMSLADALEQAHGTLPPAYCAAIRAGETSGNLAAIFERLATFHEAQDATRASLLTALIYPCLVAATSLLICVVLVTQVAPHLVTLFASTGQPLPSITQALLQGSDWLTTHWRAVGLLALAGTASMSFALAHPTTRDRAAQIALQIPILGRLAELRIAASYLRALAFVLQSHGTPISALEAAARVLTISTLRAQGVAAARAMHEGQSLAHALAPLSLLPPVARHLLETGEATARLGPMADRAAALTETLFERQQKRLIALLDPLLMVLVGSMVLVIVLAVLLPIFDLQTAMQI